MLKKIALLLIFVVLVAGGIHLVKKKRAAIKNLPEPETRVTAVATVPAVFGRYAGASFRLGQLRAKQPARLAARITARILELKVREGDRVKAGAILVRLDDRREHDRIAALSADLSAARTESKTQAAIFSRDRKLFQARAISQEALDLSRARRDSARARVVNLEKALATARTELSYTLVRAPAAGVITERLADPGDLATPGRPLLGFENPAAGYFIRVNIPQADLTRYRSGGPVRIRPDSNTGVDSTAAASPPVLAATISRLHPAVGRGQLATLEIDLAERPFGLPTGSAVGVLLQEKEVTGLRLPARALLENVDKKFVFTVDAKDRIHIVEVGVAARADDWCVVTGKLENGTRVVVAQESGLLRLHEGQPVKCQGQEAAATASPQTR